MNLLAGRKHLFHFATLFLLFFSSLFAFAGPGKTTYQAKIVKPDGYPLEATSVNFKFTILDPAGSCILYSETYSSVNMSSTGGLISFALGSGVKTYPASATTFEQVFSNITPSLSCDTGGPANYAPIATDIRKIVMQFHDGSGWQTLPAMSINAVPYAMYANEATKLNGLTSSDFVQVSTVPTCTASEALRYTGTSFSCVAVGNSVTSSTVVTALGYTPADGASLTTVTSDLSTVSSTVAGVSAYASNVSSTVFSVSSTVTSLQNSVAASFAAITSSQWTTSGTNIFYNTGNIGIGTTTPVTRLDVSGGVRIGAESTTCAPALAGTLRYNASNVEYCNGTSWQAFGVSGAGLQSFNGSTSGTQSFATGTGGTAPNFNTSNGVHTLNIPNASTGSVTAGLLSNADYTTFTNKITSSAASIAQVLGYIPADNAASGTYAQKANNLSDLTNIATARTNLGLGTFATASSIDLGSASATGTLAIARLPSFTGDATIAAASNTIILSNSGVIAGTYTKVTVDSKGRVTSGAQIASSDVTTALGYTPANSATIVSSQWSTSGTTINYMTGNVGIGTNTPSQKLEVVGNIATTTMIYSETGLYDWGSNNTGFAFPANGEVSLQTNGLSRLYVLANGNVGIGITNPSAKLELVSGTTAVAPLKFTSGTLLSSAQSGAMEYDGFNFYVTDSTNTRRTIATGSSAGTIDNASNINSSGNITMTPNGSVIVSSTTASTNSSTGALVVKGGLGVAGNINAASNLNVSGSSVIDGSFKLSSMTSGSVLFAGANGTVSQDNSNFYWDGANKRLGLGTSTFGPNGLLQVNGDIGLAGTRTIRPASNSDADTLRFLGTQVVAGQINSAAYNYTDGGLLASRSAGDSVLLLDVGRNIGSATLRIQNTISNEISAELKSFSGSSVFYASTNSGNVGIGTAAPSTQLYVQKNTASAIYGNYPAITISNQNTIGNTYANLMFESGNTAVGGITGLVGGIETYSTSNTNQKLTLKTYGSYPLYLGTADQNRLTIDATGNVGIGTNSPTSPLDITVTDTSSGIILTNTNSTTSKYPIIGVVNYAGSALGHPVLSMSNSLGTSAAPVALNAGMNMGTLLWSGQVTTSQTMQGARIDAIAEANFGANVAPTRLEFSVAPSSGSYVKRMVINSTGNVGIGTTNPTAKLNLEAGSSSVAPFKFTSGTLLTSPQSGTMEYDGANFYLTDSTNTRRAIATGSSAGTIDNASNINSSGNITMTPVGSVIVSSTTASTNSNTGALVVKGGLGVAGNINTAGNLNVSGSSVIDGSLKLSSMSSGSVLFAGANGTVTQDNANFYWDGANKRLGIGTGSPAGILHVNGAGWGDQTAIQDTSAFPTSGTGGVIIDGNYSDGRHRTRLSSIDRAGGLPLYVQRSGGVANVFSNIARFGDHTQSTMEFEVFGDAAFSGNVGIGTTAPAAKLDVNGSAIIRGGLLRQTFGDSGAAAQWVKLGRWTAAQQGRNATIRLEGGNGFNAAFDQISAIEIHLRTSNAVSVDANGFCASAVYQVLGRNQIVTAVKLVGNAAGCSATAYDVYVNAQTFTGVGSFFTVDADASTTWNTDLQFGAADPGSASSSVYIVTAETTLSNNFYVNANVGVGTTSPVSKFNVQADTDFLNGSGSAQLHITGSTNSNKRVRIGYDTTANKGAIQALTYGTSYDPLLVNPSGGNVGIGTSSPATRLDVAGGGGSIFQVVASANANATPDVDSDFLVRLMPQTTSGEGGHLEFKGSGSYQDWTIDSTSGDLRFFEPNQSRTSTKTRGGFNFMVNSSTTSSPAQFTALKIMNNGNVGIDTSTPSSYQHGGTNKVAEIYNSDTTANSQSHFILSSGNTTNADSSIGTITFAQPNMSDANKGLALIAGRTDTDYTPANPSSLLAFWTRGASETNWSQKMIIKGNGNVGIGTGTPRAKLEVANGANSDAAILATSNESNRLVVKSWDTQPAAVQTFGIVHNFNGDENNGFLKFYRGGSTSGGFVTLGTNGIEQMRINTSGNMGLGTSSPAARLNIGGLGAVDAVALRIDSQDTYKRDILMTEFNTLSYGGILRYNSGSDLFQMITLEAGVEKYGVTMARSTGFVGIGMNSAPAYMLDVSGDLRITGTPYRNGGDVAWTVPSDARLKDVVKTYDRGLQEIANIDTIIFKYKKDNPKKIDSAQEYTGVIAQQVQLQIPEAVKLDKDGFLSLNTTPIFWAMINAIKELYHKTLDLIKHDAEQDRMIASVQAENEKIKEENIELKKQNEAIKAYLCAKNPNAPICK